MKTTQVAGERGFDGGKKVNERKRHLVVDTMGNLLAVLVHAANITDRDGAKLLLKSMPTALWERLKRIWADAGYSGDLADWMKIRLPKVVLILSHAHTEPKVLYCYQDAGSLNAPLPGGVCIVT